jgi:uncharacterized protein (TIGR02145 family)
MMKTNHTGSKSVLALVVLVIGLAVGVAFGDDQKTKDRSSGRLSKVYKTVSIGSQIWMAENLDVSTFRNGDAIPEVKTAQEWLAAANSESPAWCYYNNDPGNGRKFGKLYNWYAVNDGRGIAPAGWHVPTDQEWQDLIASCGGMGKAFHELRKSDGFAAKAAGARYFRDASFNHMGKITFWWSASNNGKWNGWYHAMHFGYKQVGRDDGGMNTGHSVRCVKDKP